MVAVVAAASGKGATGASAARVGDAPGSTYQRASASDLMLDLGGASSSMATGTSGSAGFAAAATTGREVSATTGCGACAKVAGPVASGVAVGPKESAVIERVTPSANNNANASHMMVCFIAAFPTPIE